MENFDSVRPQISQDFLCELREQVIQVMGLSQEQLDKFDEISVEVDLYPVPRFIFKPKHL